MRLIVRTNFTCLCINTVVLRLISFGLFSLLLWKYTLWRSVCRKWIKINDNTTYSIVYGDLFHRFIAGIQTRLLLLLLSLLYQPFRSVITTIIIYDRHEILRRAVYYRRTSCRYTGNTISLFSAQQHARSVVARHYCYRHSRSVADSDTRVNNTFSRRSLTGRKHCNKSSSLTA